MRIDTIARMDKHLYHIFATDYRFSNMTGIQFFSIETEEHPIRRNSVIHKESLPDKFVYDKVDNILYYDNSHIYVKEIRNNGAELLISAGGIDLFMQLADDGQYHLPED